MQTFLPYADFHDSAFALDQQRCWKQLIECDQILNALAGDATPARQNHPATRMWRGCYMALVSYRNQILYAVDAWGYDHGYRVMPEARNPPLPQWFGWPALHACHRGRLLAKSQFYERYDWLETPVEENLWPVDKHGILHPECIKWLESRS
jgi:hypothetical protein